MSSTFDTQRMLSGNKMFESWFGKGFDPEKDIPDLDGKVILVTGGNTGLGKETVLQLAKHNPKEIFLAARTHSKAEAAIQDIKTNVPDARISFIQLDLTSFSSISDAAQEFQTLSDRLDILINNAGAVKPIVNLKFSSNKPQGIMATPFSMTEDGYEIQFGTNHMGHALLTRLLLPTLLKTAEQPDSDVRVINVSSEGHMFAPGILYNQDSLQRYFSLQRYGQSKLANILHARELQRRYPSITATSVHPGVIMTDLYASAKQSIFLLPLSLRFVNPFLPDVATGAHNQLWAATADKGTVRKSWYWKPVGVENRGSFWLAQKPDLAKELWDWTEEQLQRHI